VVHIAGSLDEALTELGKILHIVGILEILEIALMSEALIESFDDPFVATEADAYFVGCVASASEGLGEVLESD